MFIAMGNKPCDVTAMGCFYSSTGNTNNWRPPAHCIAQLTLSIVCAAVIHHKKTSFYVSLSSQHVYLRVGVNSCLHSEAYVVFFLLSVFLFPLWVCNCVCTPYTVHYVSLGLRVCVLTPMVRGERKWYEENRSRVSGAWNVLGFGITLANVHGKTQRGASTARQMRGWESTRLFPATPT